MTVPKVSRESAEVEDVGVLVNRSGPLDDYTLNFLTFHHDVDATPLLKGARGDECQCPHWGSVLQGRLTYRVGDHEESFEAGDAFYLPPGHIPIGNEPGSEFVQFSPTQELLETQAVMRRNMAALAPPAG
jgi:quercetin dioxygenase-like cupin family protein